MKMVKTLAVARREFLATVVTKGFLFGVLLTPAIAAGTLLLVPYLVDESAPPVEGRVLVLDPTGVVFPGIRDYLDPRAIRDRRGLLRRELPAARLIEGDVPRLEVALLPEAAEAPEATDTRGLDAAKASLRDRSDLLAVAVIDEDAVATTDGSYQLYVRARLDDRVESEIHDAIRDSIVAARVRARGLDREEIDALIHVPYRRSTTITDQGERRTQQMFGLVLPLVFMGLVLVSVIVSGQYLITTTIEEKQSRVVEMLLSAVSPMELMTGKILGQLAVGLVVLVLYSSMGLLLLLTFTMAGLLDPLLLLFTLVSYLIAFLVVASLMAAIGAAVNELREAQTLMTPLMLVVVLPWLLAMPISRSPDSTLALVTSFVPPINTFVMLLRVTSTSPPPLWQVGLSLAVGIASVYGAFWLAGKVFRVGLLMHGKPPSLRTLIRWVRMA